MRSGGKCHHLKSDRVWVVKTSIIRGITTIFNDYLKGEGGRRKEALKEGRHECELGLIYLSKWTEESSPLLVFPHNTIVKDSHASPWACRLKLWSPWVSWTRPKFSYDHGDSYKIDSLSVQSSSLSNWSGNPGPYTHP